jgi:hypothetical protein
MNRIAAITLFSIATLMTAGNASAQSAVLKVDVPFSFTVNGEALPAGNYSFGFDSMVPDLLIVRDGANSVKARSLGERGSIGAGEPRTLIFHRYGGQYFLSVIHFGSASNGAFLPETKLEREAGRVSREEDLAFVAGH